MAEALCFGHSRLFAGALWPWRKRLGNVLAVSLSGEGGALLPVFRGDGDGLSVRQTDDPSASPRREGHNNTLRSDANAKREQERAGTAAEEAPFKAGAGLHGLFPDPALADWFPDLQGLSLRLFPVLQLYRLGPDAGRPLDRPGELRQGVHHTPECEGVAGDVCLRLHDGAVEADLCAVHRLHPELQDQGRGPVPHGVLRAVHPGRFHGHRGAVARAVQE